ncbi:toxin-antitoxin system YwqK family antitoxin [Winogradskyella litorisediminis]|uniref:Toxin-antitoxin system YwqK family antitoxin n=1 Tax=Winogradskyella litorisediminis TaxID=1156618 RepID=A0ABW3N5D0_9FLAO
MKKIAVILLMLCVGFTYAQKERTLTLNKEKDLIEVVYFHDNGEVSQTGFYTKDGKLHGDWYSFCQEGNKITSAKYDNGKKVGKWFYWSGDKLKEVDYSNNKIARVNEWINKTEVASNR